MCMVLLSHLIIYLDYIATGVCGGLRLRAVHIPLVIDSCIALSIVLCSLYAC